MPALPTPGGSTGTWGDELNEFLQVVHNADGTVDAASIDVADAGGNYTGTNVEDVLTELAGASGVDDVNLIVHMEVFS